MPSDVAAERVVLGGIYNHGEAVYYDIAEFVQADTFTDKTNAALFTCLAELIDKRGVTKLDHSSVISIANELNLRWLFEKKEDVEHIRAIFSSQINPQNVRMWAAKLRKLQIMRMLEEQLKEAGKSIHDLTGSEPIEHIIGLAENSVLDFTQLLTTGVANEPVLLGSSVEEFIQYLEDNPRQLVGVSTGYSLFDQAIGGGVRRKSVSLIGARSGVGKCFKKDTQILMYDGTTKNVQDIVVGDVIMGDDSTPRNILNICNGVDMMYEVKPVKGESFYVNSGHILSVKMTDNAQHIKKGDIYDINIVNYLHSNYRFKHFAKLYRVPVEFQAQPIDIDPYILGTWLGDGTSSETSITTTDDVIIKAWKSEAEKSLLRISDAQPHDKPHIHLIRLCSRVRGKQNTFLLALRKYDLIKNKHIPLSYKANDRNVRLELLAGLIDTDGHLIHGCYDIVQKNKVLADDIVYIARSLGLSAYVKQCTKSCQNGFSGTYHRITISGDIDMIPTRIQYKKALPRKQIKDILVTGFTVTEVGLGEYFGFETDGNHRFLLGDFTVTHNSVLAANIGLHTASAIKIPTLYLDTEMDVRDHQARTLANLTFDTRRVTINDIETGDFAELPSQKEAVHNAGKVLKDIPLHYMNVSGRPFEDILSIMRRWIHRHVGFDEETGSTKPCLIIYDYLKLMSADGINHNIAEYQLLGFITTSLHNFAVRYDVPILSFIQLNRDGIDRENTSAIAQSDRILWLVTNFSIFKNKSPEEIAKDGPENGTHKIVICKARHGSGLAGNDYINYNMYGKFAKIIEVNTSNMIRSQNASSAIPFD